MRTITGRPGNTNSPAGHHEPPAASLKLRVALFIRRHHLAPYFMLVPSIIAVGIMVVYPAVQILAHSFQNYGLLQVVGRQPITWVGFSNYSLILHDPEFWSSLRISLIFAAVVVPLTLITGTLVGLLLNRLGRKMSAFVSGAAMLAWATPAVTASVIFYWLANPDGGVVDWTLANMPHWLGGGAHWAGYSWTNSTLPAYTLLTVLLIWQSFPFIAVSVLAGLKTVPAELHESARVDGANSWRIFWRITFPLLKPIYLVLLLLSIIWDFGAFTQVYILIGPGNTDEYNLGMYEYQRAFTTPPSFSIASAAAFVLTLVLLIITVGYVRSSVRQGAIK
ncbi:MAG TPA: sugar ABC transporter permease [Streptosporangiaceae bacterium]